MEGEDLSRQKADVYIKTVEAMIEHLPMFRPIVQRVKKGIRELVKESEAELARLRATIRKDAAAAQDQSLENARLIQELNDLERNETECRNQVQGLTQEIDKREDRIELLEDEVEELQMKNRQLFKE